jgi:hypothetical protein
MIGASQVLEVLSVERIEGHRLTMMAQSLSRAAEAMAPKERRQVRSFSPGGNGSSRRLRIASVDDAISAA